MDIGLHEVSAYIEHVSEMAGGPRKLAEQLGVSHQTIYNLMAGGWPSKVVAEKLNLRLVVKPSSNIGPKS